MSLLKDLAVYFFTKLGLYTFPVQELHTALVTQSIGEIDVLKVMKVKQVQEFINHHQNVKELMRGFISNDGTLIHPEKLYRMTQDNNDLLEFYIAVRPILLTSGGIEQIRERLLHIDSLIEQGLELTIRTA